jgi:hypothetical protein
LVQILSVKDALSKIVGAFPRRTGLETFLASPANAANGPDGTTGPWPIGRPLLFGERVPHIDG